MHTSTVFHTPGTIDACPMEGKMHLRLRANRGTLQSASLIYNCNKNLWWEFRDEVPMQITFTDSEFDYYSVSVELTDTRFAYIFRLQCTDGKERYLSEEGLTEGYDHSLGYFSFFQYTAQFPCDLMHTPAWVRTASCYQIFPERFFLGNRQKDLRYVNAAWGEKPTPKSFYGGDLDGIRQKLPYLEELGVELLYLTPVFCSPSNHKYDITDYENVDPAFGGNEALKALIEAAHCRGMRIMLDGVFNHISCEHPFFLDARKRSTDSPYYDWFFFRADGGYRTFANVPYMPKLNTGKDAVIRYFSEVAVRWMRDYGADGWRLDVSDEISRRFLRRFREAVLAQEPDAIIIGEDWHRAAQYLNGDEYDGIMNYGFTKACLDLLAFETIDPSGFRDRVVRLYHTFSLAANEKMLNLLGSHDTDRFLTRVRGDGRKYRAAAAMLFFYPGIPCVYYGDEIGTEGGYDPDCRRCFDWDETHWDTETHALIRRLMHLKKGPALSHGTFSLTERDGILTFTRSAEEQTLILRLNATSTPRAHLAPYGFEIKEK